MLWIYESVTFPFCRTGPVIDCPLQPSLWQTARNAYLRSLQACRELQIHQVKLSKNYLIPG